MRITNVLAVLGLLALTACVSTRQPVQPDSLSHFQAALVDLNVQSTSALQAEYDWNYRNFKEQVKAENQLDPRPITLRFCGGDDFEWQWGDCGTDSSNLPVFKVIAESKYRLAKLNQMLIDYANFLILFNGANENTKKALEDSAEKIGASAKSIAATFGATLNEEKFGAFSTIGVNIVQQYLAKKQRDGMAAVMAEFHPGVVEYARLGSTAMKISAIGIEEEYNAENPRFTRKIPVEQDAAKRLALVEKLLALNEKTTPQLDILKSLSAAYEAIPPAHAGLMTALQSGYNPTLEELVAHIELIASIQERLEVSSDN